MLRKALEQIDAELAKQVNHVYEYPILDISVVLELPEVDAIEFNRLVRRLRIEVVAGVCCQYAGPTRPAAVGPSAISASRSWTWRSG